MKLSTHYTRASILISIGVLLLGSLIYFYTIKKLARDQLDRDLTEEIDERISYVKATNSLPSVVDFDDDQSAFIKISGPNISRKFFDTLYYDSKEKKTEQGRAVEDLVQVNGLNYKAIVAISHGNTDHLIQIISFITIILVFALITTLVITNRFLLQSLWRPFYKLLDELRTFNVADDSKFVGVNSNVDEFNELNSAVGLMASRVSNDFQNLKHFTENASHEMLTPLSVITSKLDTLIQDETLRLEQYNQINDIYSAAGKLSRLNQSLLLLVKIENKLIEESEWVDVKALVLEKERQFHELIESKGISLNLDLETIKLLVSRYLIDILLNNLISNAIRHNVAGGSLEIILSQKKLLIQNTGLPIPLNPDAVFERFQKGSKSEGIGLGLTIVRNICHLYSWEISYSHPKSWHSFLVDFT